MKKKVAVLLDGGHVRFSLYPLLGNKKASAEDIEKYAKLSVKDGEELFRIYYYDSRPFGDQRRNPISGRDVRFNQTNQYKHSSTMISTLETKDNFAFRSGQLQFENWAINKSAFKKICEMSQNGQSIPPISESEVVPVFRQKAVDIKIGLDIAWLAAKRIVDKIILSTNDSDFVPAMKFARREGIHVVMLDLGNVQNVLKAHADEVRTVRI